MFDAAAAADVCDVLFLAQENGAALQSAPTILEMGKRVIDLSADFRLRDPRQYEQWYRIPHTALKSLNDAVYGLPELHRSQIKTTRMIANPGCYSTASILALAPLLHGGMVEPQGIILDGKSGVSGAGRSKSDTMYRYAEANESTRPYNIGGSHRHTPEIEQELREVLSTTEDSLAVTFTPHLVPMTRGLLVTAYARLVHRDTATADILHVLRDFYADAPFVIVRDANDYPSTKDVYGSNFAHLCAKSDSRTGMVTVVSAIDNLGKGMAGQAVQNMNLMCGLPETMGLEGGGLWP